MNDARIIDWLSVNSHEYCHKNKALLWYDYKGNSHTTFGLIREAVMQAIWEQDNIFADTD